MTVHGHLHPIAARALELPAAERVLFLEQDRWIGYTRASEIMKQLDDLFVYPKNIRMPCTLLVGRSNNGKSSIISHFLKRHPPEIREDGTSGPCAIWVSMPGTPTEGNFWSEVLTSMLIRHREKDPPERKRRQAFEVMENLSVRLIAIDEFNHLVNAGKEAAKLLAAIKNLSTTLRLPIVAAGTQEAIHALNSDPQMKSRFEPAVLDRWKLNNEYRRFLASFEMFLPLPEPSNLGDPRLAAAIYGMGGDTIGGTVRMLRRAAAIAIARGKSMIDVDLLSAIRNGDPGGWDDAVRRA